MIYLSTDLVYDGNRGSYLSEDFRLNPISPYAESKLIGEEKVREFSDNYLIFRLALLIGFGLNHSVCHFQSMYENLLNNKPAKLFTDQFRSPISLLETSKVLEKVIDLNIPSGIYNLGGNERISRFDIGLMLADLIKANKDLLIPLSLNEASQVPKVKDVSLNIFKLKDCGIEISSLEKMIFDSFTFNKQISFP
jgi:dTDP-4-dehydrorhamnose reductase